MPWPSAWPSCCNVRTQPFNQLTNQCSLPRVRVPKSAQPRGLREAPDRTSGATGTRAGTRDQDRGTLACSTTGMSLAGLPSGRPGRRQTPAGCSSIRSIRCTHTPVGRSAVAACEVFERATRRYSKPEFGIAAHQGRRPLGARHRGGGVADAVLPPRPFQARHRSRRARAQHPRLLLVAPMSGHFATLLRGTVETFLPDHEVYITDWQDARDVPLSAGPLRPRRLHRHHGRHVPLLRRRRARVCRVPAVRAGAGRHRADGGGRRSGRAADADPRRRPDRHAHQPDRGQHAGREARHRLVPPQRHHQRALAVPGPRPAGLSGLPAAVGLHDHEPRPAHAGAEGHVPASGARRRRLGRQASRVLRRVSGRDGPDGRVLPADGRYRVRAAPDAARTDDARAAGPSTLPPSAGRR